MMPSITITKKTRFFGTEVVYPRIQVKVVYRGNVLEGFFTNNA